MPPKTVWRFIVLLKANLFADTAIRNIKRAKISAQPLGNGKKRNHFQIVCTYEK